MKRIVFFATFLLLMIAAFCIGASAQIYEGRALDEGYIRGWENGVPPEGYQETFKLAAYYDVQYRLDTETGVLRIFCGERNPQKMLPYADGDWVPWTKEHMRPYIKTVIIEEGILSAGMYSFYKCENLETVYLPHSLLRVDNTCFYECPKLRNVYYAGSKADFERYVQFDDVRNSYTGDIHERRVLNMITYGESVWVRCINQDGEIFMNYTVGGYAVGDEYVITPPAAEGLTYLGKKSEIRGFYKENDSSVFVFKYRCEHQYELKNENQFCSYVCTHCGCGDPSKEDWHTFEVKKEIKRGLFRDGEVSKTCSVCGLKRYHSELAYIWTILVVASVLVIGTCIFCAVFFPLRRYKRIKDLTW
ncbi:MAG: leucine-rich repeat protein [Clostridia bacterium]|nr:leucine-rich repeat protein [Clostridia bacterium]